MNIIRAADVGDGLCVTLHSDFSQSVQFDCGSQEGGETSARGLLRNSHLFGLDDAFILSHFHSDHYNGLCQTSRLSPHLPFYFRRVFFPRIPEFKERHVFLAQLFAMNAMILGNESGVMEYDLLDVVTRINGGRPPQHGALSARDQVYFDGSRIEVIWPPQTVGKRALTAIKRAIEDFDRAKERDEVTRNLYNRVVDDQRSQRYLDVKQDDREEMGDRDNEAIEEYPEAFKRKELPKAVAKANDSLRRAANHLSLIAFQDNRFLFFGDAEPAEIKAAIKNLESDGRTKFFAMINPHHGTHWHESLREIECIHSISSSGKKLFPKVKPQFKEISKFHHVTSLVGDVVIPDCSFTWAPWHW